MIIFDGLRKVTSLVLTCTPRISCVNMVRVDFKDCSEIIYALLKLPNLFESTPSYIICPRILGVELHQRIAILNGLSESALLKKRGGTDKQSLFV